MITLQPRHRHDTDDPLVVTLGDSNGPRDLSDATSVLLTMVNAATGVVKINRAACTVLQTGTAPNILNQGQVSYAWQAADVDTVGIFKIQWTVLRTGGRQLTWPGAADWAQQVFLTDLDNV